MRTTVRTLAPLAFAALSAIASAQNPSPFQGGYGVKTSNYEYNGALTGQFDGGRGAFAAESYGTGDYYDPLFGNSLTGDAHAHGSLYTGTVGAATSGSGETANVTQTGGLSTEAHARLWDTVTLTGPNVMSMTIPIQFALDGFTVSSGWTATSFATFQYWVYDKDFGKTILGGTVYAHGNTTFDAAIPNGNSLLYNGDRHLQIGYELTAYSDLSNQAVGVLQTGANFYNTLHFMWDLPQGVTVGDSTPYGGSGLFNPPAIGPVQATPEPASFAALGIGALSLLRRTKSRRSGIFR